MYEKIPQAARLPCENTLWVNNRGDVLSERQVIGERVLIRQQPALPPSSPQILVLTDQVMELWQNNDKYLKVIPMMGYTLKNYTQDIRDGFIELQFPYIIIYVGTMQVGLFDPKKVHREVFEVLKAINERNKMSHIVFCSLAPHPLDHVRSKKIYENYSLVYQKAVDKNRRKYGWNCGYVDLQMDFLVKDGHMKEAEKYFVEQLYLSQEGIQLIRASWLRHLGFFPQKVVAIKV